jgi:DNA-directed RNA polymerase II subunit RPB11
MLYDSFRIDLSLGVPSAAVFTFNKEDHTLGNMIRSRLSQSSHVLFAGYKVRSVPLLCKESRLIALMQVPHPLIPKFELRVQTDGEITPKDAVVAACHELVKDLGILSREFTKEFELRKMVGATQQQQNGAQDGI